MSQRLLVTGAAGFIGSNLTRILVNKGFSVRTFVRHNSRADIGSLSFLSKDELNSIEIIFGDLRDSSAVIQAARGCDLIYHLGAIISIPYSYLHPVETVESNILGTLNVLEAAKQLEIPVVHTSTSKVYGNAIRVPIDEEHPLMGMSPYSASKISADKLVEAYYYSYNLPVITVRPFNTYGPGQSQHAIIPNIIQQTLTRNSINVGSLITRRDFTYVDDIVSGFLSAGETLQIGFNEFRAKQKAKDDLTARFQKLTKAQEEIEKSPLIKKPFPTDSLDPKTGDPLINNPCDTAPISHPAPFIVDYDPSEEQLEYSRENKNGWKNNSLGETFNLGTGTDYSIGEIVEMILRIIGKQGMPICQDVDRFRSHTSELMHLLSDNSKARDFLGWQPTVTLEEGLERTIEWTKANLDIRHFTN